MRRTAVPYRILGLSGLVLLAPAATEGEGSGRQTDAWTPALRRSRGLGRRKSVVPPLSPVIKHLDLGSRTSRSAIYMGHPLSGPSAGAACMSIMMGSRFRAVSQPSLRKSTNGGGGGLQYGGWMGRWYYWNCLTGWRRLEVGTDQEERKRAETSTRREGGRTRQRHGGGGAGRRK